MKSHVSPRFRKLFKGLPPDVQKAARKNYRLWKDNPGHPSLDFKSVHPSRPIYSIRVGMGWRAIALVDGDIISWFWIGSHNTYEKLLRQL